MGLSGQAIIFEPQNWQQLSSNYQYQISQKHLIATYYSQLHVKYVVFVPSFVAEAICHWSHNVVSHEVLPAIHPENKMHNALLSLTAP
jgi:hypothetical protein